MHLIMLAYPGMTQLDLTGPFEVFRRSPEFQVDLVWKTSDPVVDASGLRLITTATLDHCPRADILFVPGGPGQLPLMDDAALLAFLARQGADARIVTSVCTGSLLLGAAGLLAGYRATCHWLSLDQLASFGAIPVAERVVVDRDRITGAGVTSGIDFALRLTAILLGDERAGRIRLAIEYDPDPSIAGGSPATADPRHVEAIRTEAASFQAKRAEAAARAAGRLTRSGAAES